MLAFALLGLLAWRHTAGPLVPSRLLPRPAPIGAWAWVGGMALMLAALLAAHAAEGLDAAAILKSAVGWAKGWWLLAAYIVIGACLQVRAETVTHAVCRLAVQTLLLVPLLAAAPFLHLPPRLFVSPLQIVGGPGPEYFAVQLYIIDPVTHGPRWPFFAPWAPAAGMVGDMMFLCALHERSPRLRCAALASAVLLCLMTASRMSIVFLAVGPPLVWTLSRLADRRVLAGLAAASALGGLAAGPVMEAVSDGVSAFRSARASSSRVREALGRIAIDRWWTEARLFGHGIVQRGPHLVEFMPIGSHHTWYGLLYVKGIAGVVALAVPLSWSLLEMLLLAQVSRTGRLGLGMALLLLFYTFGENLEILPYLYYPALVLIGVATAEAAGDGVGAGTG